MKPIAFEISKPNLRGDETMTGRTERKSSKESGPYVDYDEKTVARPKGANMIV
jgi:hypothetical protein